MSGLAKGYLQGNSRTTHIITMFHQTLRMPLAAIPKLRMNRHRFSISGGQLLSSPLLFFLNHIPRCLQSLVQVSFRALREMEGKSYNIQLQTVFLTKQSTNDDVGHGNHDYTSTLRL